MKYEGKYPRHGQLNRNNNELNISDGFLPTSLRGMRMSENLTIGLGPLPLTLLRTSRLCHLHKVSVYNF